MNEVVLEIGDPEAVPPGVIVYLDQLHWVTLAQQVWAPEKVAARERQAAERLIELSEARLITIPLSSGNLIEMSQLDGKRRRHLATTMLRLSRGWQMRNPIAVRGEELRRVLSREAPVLPNVFTLDPGAMFAEGIEPPDPIQDLPPEWQQTFQALTTVNSMVATVIEDKKIISIEGREKAALWAQIHGNLATYMRDDCTPREHKRSSALTALLTDLRQEIGAAANDVAISQDDFSHWLQEDLEEDLARLPYLGRHHEVIHRRLSNADEKWEANDLVDINYLCCAAGYADVMVGEKKTAEHLKRVEKKVSVGAYVCRTLAQAAERIDELIADADASRAGAQTP